MDPSSIVAACVDIAATITKTSVSVAGFVRTTRVARQDLALTSRQLGELRVTLDLLREDQGEPRSLPASIRNQIKSILHNCKAILLELDTMLAKYKDDATLTRWTVAGKDEVGELNEQLEAHIRALNLAVDVSTPAVALAIKDDIGAPRNDSPRILDGISELRATLRISGSRPWENRRDLIQQYLESITAYAETTLDGTSVEKNQVCGSAKPILGKMITVRNVKKEDDATQPFTGKLFRAGKVSEESPANSRAIQAARHDGQ